MAELPGGFGRMPDGSNAPAGRVGTIAILAPPTRVT